MHKSDTCLASEALRLAPGAAGGRSWRSLALAPGSVLLAGPREQLDLGTPPRPALSPLFPSSLPPPLLLRPALLPAQGLPASPSAAAAPNFLPPALQPGAPAMRERPDRAAA